MPSNTRSSIATLFSLVVFATSCQKEEHQVAPDPSPPTPSEAANALSETRLQQLRALGYTSWDENADSSLQSVVAFDQQRSGPGYNLYTNDIDEVYLMDRNGKRVHTWRLPGRKKCEYAELLEDGTLWVVCVQHSLVKLDWASQILWEHKMKVHHDVAPGPDQNALVPVTMDVVKYRGRMVKFDGISEVTRAGEIRDIWSSYAVLEMLKKIHHPSELDVPDRAGKGGESRVYNYYHLNTVEILPASERYGGDSRFRKGNLLICLRNVNLVLILDQNDFSVVWHWGIDDLDAPHMPTMLENGNILIYDNGYSRAYSRVIELDPVTLNIVWSYHATPKSAFFSPRRGSSHRLANGNTLIAEAERGHAFEVTPAGDVVWDFWNPEIVDGKRKQIYRLMRLPPETVEPLLEGME